MELTSTNILDKIKLEYPTKKADDLANELGLKTHQVYRLAYSMGLKKDASFYDNPANGRFNKLMRQGYCHRFKKGSIPYNKGKKMNLTPEAKKAQAPTQFKAGQVPHNSYPDGTEVIFKDSKGIKYYKIKVPGVNKLVFKHVWMYQELIGIPPQHIVRFKDGNTLNCVIENLEAITRKEHMLRNTIHRYPDELKSVMKLVSKLKNKIKTHEKQD